MKSPRPTDPVQSLYICATPIGNLGDITQRALDTLRSVSLIFAEDTRMTQRLLTHFGIKTPLKSLHKFNEASRINQVLELLQNNQSIALVSDAGTPCICDPGYRIVAAVRDAGFAVTAIPGASALAAFLSVAGISADRFMFTGFVPKRPQDWKADCETAAAARLPIVFFETSVRLQTTMRWIAREFPGTELILAKELTKIYETVLSGSVEDLLETETVVKGEWVGAARFPILESTVSVPETVNRLADIGLSPRQIAEVADQFLGLPKNEVYRMATKAKSS